MEGFAYQLSSSMKKTNHHAFLLGKERYRSVKKSGVLLNALFLSSHLQQRCA